MSDNKMYLLIKYIKSVLWSVAKRLSYIKDAQCLKLATGCSTVVLYATTSALRKRPVQRVTGPNIQLCWSAIPCRAGK